MTRDDYERGVSKEYELIKTINKICKFRCLKNWNQYDIDLVIPLSGKRKILIEVEETSKRFWPSKYPRPRYPSKLLTMPIRKVKYFIDDYDKLEKKSISTIEEFDALYPCYTVFRPRSRKDEIRLYIKGNYNLEYLSVVREDIIVRSLNCKLKDQRLVTQRINWLKQRNGKWQFYRNLWFNPIVKNMKGETRSDPVMLILGLINAKNDIIWAKRAEICSVLKNLIGQKWGIDT